jgi:biotin carboxylase
LISSGRFLLIAQPESYRIAPYLAAATRMGLEVLIASRGEHSLISEVHAGLHIDTADPDSALQRIINQAHQTPFVGVLGSDDSTVELAARVAHALGLPHNPPRAARLSRRKDLAREQLALAGCPVPGNRLIDLRKPIDRQQTGLEWPCVIKPLHLSASRGVIRVNNYPEFTAACTRIAGIIANYGDEFEKNHLLVEDYIDGIEVAYEGYLHNGKLHTLVLFDKPDPLQGPYFEETIYVTPSRLDPSIQALIEQRVTQACAAYGLTTGPVHAELRIDARDAWILEVASRTIGGDCARSLDNGTEFNLEELAISLAIGNPPAIRPPEEARGVMMIPIRQGGMLRRVEGIMAAHKVPHIEKVDIIVREGNELIPLPEGNQYPGYIFARAASPEAVVDALRNAHAHLNFVVAPVFRMTPR